jgi:hypothetical protein
MGRIAWRRVIALGLGGLAATGCTSNGAPTLGLPSASDLNIGALPSLPGSVPHQGRTVGTPTEVYTRVARGVLTCWFGAAGPLKAHYIYHADADPPSKGGRSEIVLFEKDTAAEDPRTLRVYRLLIATVEEKTKLEIENLKLAEPLATRLNSDVWRWAANEEGCGEGPITAGWSAAEKAAPAGAKKSSRPAARK